MLSVVAYNYASQRDFVISVRLKIFELILVPYMSSEAHYGLRRF